MGDSFFSGPTSTLTEMDNTTSLTTSKSYQITLGAKVDGTQPAGTYKGQFVFTATANTVSYNVRHTIRNIEICATKRHCHPNRTPKLCAACDLRILRSQRRFFMFCPKN